MIHIDMVRSISNLNPVMLINKEQRKQKKRQYEFWKKPKYEIREMERKLFNKKRRFPIYKGSRRFSLYHIYNWNETGLHWPIHKEGGFLNMKRRGQIWHIWNKQFGCRKGQDKKMGLQIV